MPINEVAGSAMPRSQVLPNLIRRSRIKLTFLFLGIFLYTCPATAADIAVFSGDASPPKMYLQNGVNRGILVDILNYANQQLQEDKLRVTLLPWARSYQLALAGEVGILGLSWTQRRDDLFDYSMPIFIDKVVVVVRKDNVFPFKSLEDLNGRRVGVLRGATYGEEFERALETKRFEVDVDSGVENRLNKLKLGRIDCGLFSVGKAGFIEALRLSKFPEDFESSFVVLPVPLRNDPNYLAFPKSMHMGKWLTQFNRVIKNGYAQGDIQKIIALNINLAAPN